MPEPLRIAMIGAGRVADVHANALRKLAARAALCGFAEIRGDARNARASEWGVPGFDSTESLIASCQPDALLILLPHHARLVAIRSCLQAGKAVLLEKPLAISIPEGEAVVAEVARTSGRLLVGHNGLYHPDFACAREAVTSGWIGKITSVRAQSAGWLGFRPWDFRTRLAETGGGVWMDTGSHLVYCLTALAGGIEAIQCLTGRLARDEMEGEDHAVLNLRFACGALGQVFASYGHKRPGYQADWPGGYALSIEVTGTIGAVRYELCPKGRVELFSEHPGAPVGAREGWVGIGDAKPYEASFDRQMEHFLDVASGRANPLVSAEDALAVLRVLRSAYDLEAAGCRVL